MILVNTFTMHPNTILLTIWYIYTNWMVMVNVVMKVIYNLLKTVFFYHLHVKIVVVKVNNYFMNYVPNHFIFVVLIFYMVYQQLLIIIHYQRINLEIQQILLLLQVLVVVIIIIIFPTT